MENEILNCQARMENLNAVIDFVESVANRFNIETPKKFGLLVAIEEAFVNVCHYAYPQAEGDVSISCGSDKDAFVFEISDSGEPFDVLSLSEPDTTSDLMDRKIGGLGVFFIRKLTNDLSYRREGGQNILRMVIRDPAQ